MFQCRVLRLPRTPVSPLYLLFSVSRFPVFSLLFFINGLGKVSANGLHLPEVGACLLDSKWAWNPQEEVNIEIGKVTLEDK